MKLVKRVSVFFLAALAVVLLVYSGALYFFVRTRLTQQFEQELRAAISSLVAAVEVEPEEVKWQPLEHVIALGTIQGPDEVQWIVIGDREQIAEQSRNASAELVAYAKNLAPETASNPSSDVLSSNGELRLLSRRLVAPAPDRSQRELDEFDEIMVVVARSVVPLSTNLNRLLLLVCALPLGAWLMAAAAGRWFCGRALQPVWDMARHARSMKGADFRSRLPVSLAGDELADLANAFNALLDHQDRAFEQQRRFVGDAAHELRTPLTVLLGQVEVALRQVRSQEEYAKTLGILRLQAMELQKMVESLLFLARSEKETLLPNPETFFLNPWLSDYLTRWNGHARWLDLMLCVNSHEDCQIVASKALLVRLLDNLIENALKYSPAGSRVVVELPKDDVGVVVAVVNQGRGIAAEDIPAIFEPFYRSQAAREAGITGTGLGLAIAARITVAHGGRLTCTSDSQQGTRFAIWLPRA